MKFFRPELYVRLNSSDEEVADAAEEALERAGDDYNQYFAQLRTEFPTSVVEFVEQLTLHDADVFAPAKLSNSFGPWQVGDVILVVQQVNTLCSEYVNTLGFLQYGGCNDVAVVSPILSDVFSPLQPTWLYDEFHVEDDGNFSHHILLSSGEVIRINFRDFRWDTAPLAIPVRGTVPQET